MTISARLSLKTQLALARYCKAHGLTKTQALERGIDLLLRHEGAGAHHPAFLAYQRLRERKFAPAVARPSQQSTQAIKRYLDAKHSRLGISLMPGRDFTAFRSNVFCDAGEGFHGMPVQSTRDGANCA